MPPNTGVAPVCNAKAEPPSFASKPPRLPVYAVPSAGNPQSLVRAIQQLQAAVAALAVAVPPNNTPNIPAVGGGGGPGNQHGSGGATSPDQQQEPSQWVEKNRVTQNVKVVNPDDDSQFVIVKEIVSITMEDQTTGVQMVIKRDP